jgi:cytochrome c peroxidase
MNKLYLLLSLCFFSVLVSCQDDPETAPEATPLTISRPEGFSEMQIPADNPTTIQGVALGRKLFYDKRLSSNNTQSCGSCHQQSKAFTDGKAFSEGAKGAFGTRSSMSLANAGWFPALMWDGKAQTLEQQAHMPIENPVEMASKMPEVIARLQATSEYPRLFKEAFGSSKISPQNISKAIAQFERTLVSANSKFDRYKRQQEALSPQELRGFKLFATHPDPGKNLRGGNCGDCHGSTGLFDRGLDGEFSNNGLDENPTDSGLGGTSANPADMGKFKIPTLRNVALTAPYMHDGRFQTLEEVLTHYNEHIKFNSPNLSVQMAASNNNQNDDPADPRLGLTPAEIADIIAFLNTLTDTEFVTNPAHSDPF